MVAVEIDADMCIADMYRGGSATVSVGLFGGTAISYLRNTWENFSTSSDHLGLTHIRWPGGSASEKGYFDPTLESPRIWFVEGDPPSGWQKAYSIDRLTLIHPQLVASGGYVSFDTVLSSAIESGRTLSIVVPVEAEFSVGQTSSLEAKFARFIEGLFAEYGKELAQLSEPIVLEIGNEQYDRPEAYAKAVFAAASAAESFRESHPEKNFALAAQSMNTEDASHILVDALRALANGHTLSQIDMVRHHFLNIGFKNAQGLEDNTIRSDAVSGLIQVLEENGRPSGSLTLYASAYSAGSSDLRFSDVGDRGTPFALAAAGTAAALVASLVEMGYTLGAIWGVASSPNNETVASSNIDGRIEYSAFGEAIGLMSKTLLGMSLLSTPHLNDTRDSADYFEFAYVDDSKMVVILAADDLPSDAIDITLNLRDFGPIGAVCSEQIKVVNGSLVGPVTTVKSSVNYTSDSVTVSLENDFDYIQVTIARASPGTAFMHLWGGSSADRLVAGSGGVVFEGNEGNDSLIGGQGVDRLFGGIGNDMLQGQEGDDSLIGGDGNNWLNGGRGSDHLGALAGNDSLYGADGSDTIVAGGGRDLAYGGIGNDRLYGERDNDTLYGDFGDDFMSGGHGNDTLFAGDGRDRIVGDIGSDVLYGGSGSDVLYGGLQNDRLYGERDADALHGDAGDDFLNGGQGNDSLFGGDGVDRLVGDIGIDVLFGGAGADTFVFKASEMQDGLVAAIIRDFKDSEDRLDFSEWAAGFVRSGEFSAIGEKEVRSEISGNSTIFVLDADGDGVGDISIWLDGFHDLSNISILWM